MVVLTNAFFLTIMSVLWALISASNTDTLFSTESPFITITIPGVFLFAGSSAAGCEDASISYSLGLIVPNNGSNFPLPDISASNILPISPTGYATVPVGLIFDAILSAVSSTSSIVIVRLFVMVLPSSSVPSTLIVSPTSK